MIEAESCNNRWRRRNWKVVCLVCGWVIDQGEQVNDMRVSFFRWI